MSGQIVLRAIAAGLMIGLMALILWRWQINGWGSIVWLASAIFMMVIRGPYAARNKENVISEQFAINTERVLLFLVTVGGTLLPVVHFSTGLLGTALARSNRHSALDSRSLVVLAEPCRPRTQLECHD